MNSKEISCIIIFTKFIIPTSRIYFERKFPIYNFQWKDYTLPHKHSVHWGIKPPSKTPPFSCQASPLNLKTVQAAPFQAIPPPYWFFVNPSPQKILAFFVLNPILYFKSN